MDYSDEHCYGQRQLTVKRSIIVLTTVYQGSRLYLNLRGFIAGATLPSFSPMELDHHVEQPSGDTSEKISCGQPHRRRQQAAFAFWDAGIEAFKNTLPRRSVLECKRFDDVDNIVQHSTVKAHIPSLSFEPGEFDDFMPETISSSELELASRAAREVHVHDGGYSEAQSASGSSRTTLCVHAHVQSLATSSTSLDCMGRSFNSVQSQRPRFSLASSDFDVFSNGSLT